MIKEIQNSQDEFFIEVAFKLSKKSHCVSKQVGAVLVKDGRIISMGYNGSHPGHVNCCNVFNRKTIDFDKHHAWSRIFEVHAEMNCLAFAAKNGINVNGCTMYVTMSPCQDCLKTLFQAGIRRIVFLVQYHRNVIPQEMTEYMEKSGISLERIVPEKMFLSKDDCIKCFDTGVELFRAVVEDSIKYHTSEIPDTEIDLKNELQQRYFHIKNSLKLF